MLIIIFNFPNHIFATFFAVSSFHNRTVVRCWMWVVDIVLGFYIHIFDNFFLFRMLP